MKTQSLSLLTNFKEHTVENLFSLAITKKRSSTKIIMQLLISHVNTAHIPFIVELLQQHLPNVLLTHCYNPENLPFVVEVRQTEIGHLFEHILLEYLCQLKIAKGFETADFSGRTRWNWVKDPQGKFHIYLNCGEKDADILPIALEKSVTLMKIILQTDQTPLFPSRRFYSQRNGLKNGKRLGRKVKQFSR